MVVRVLGQLRCMHAAATAAVSCLASRVACSVSLRTARSAEREARYTQRYRGWLFPDTWFLRGTLPGCVLCLTLPSSARHLKLKPLR
eukprot:1923315-Prymnesium_polylepis.1